MARHGSLFDGIDVDLLCRGTEEQIRRRVRGVLDAWQPGGGYCLGSGNASASQTPLESHLIALGDGRRYAG